jgi:hypothetical protein
MQGRAGRLYAAIVGVAQTGTDHGAQNTVKVSAFMFFLPK